MNSIAELRAHDLPPDPVVPPADRPSPPPPAPDLDPPPVEEPPYEHPTPIREPSQTPSPMAAWSCPVAAARPRALVLCPLASDEVLRLAGATCDVFDDAGIEVDMLPIPEPTGQPDLQQRMALAQAVMVVASPAHATVLAAVLGSITVDTAMRSTGRAYAMVLTGTQDAADAARRRLTDAFDDLGLIDAAAQARFDRFLGCEWCAEAGHGGWPDDEPMQAHAAGAAHLLVDAANEIGAGRMTRPDLLLARPRPVHGLSR